MILFLSKFTINVTILILKLSISHLRWCCSSLYILWSYISKLIRFPKASSHVTDFNTRNKLLFQKLKNSSATRYISEPIFYGDLVHKFKRIVGKPNFSDQFNKIVKRYIRVGYNLDIMRQSACQVLNPITVYSYGLLFNCTTVGQASDSMTALT